MQDISLLSLTQEALEFTTGLTLLVVPKLTKSFFSATSNIKRKINLSAEQKK